MRERTSASQACGSTPFILAVTMRLYMAAARCLPRSDPQNSHDFSTQGDTSQPSFGGVVREADASVFEEEGEACPALENVFDRFGQVVPTSEPSDLRTHIDMKIVDQWPAQHLPDGQAFLGALAVDGSLDLEQRVDTAHDLDRDG